MTYKTIKIAFKSGNEAIWDAEAGEWDDYFYDGKMFIVIKNKAWVGFYNIDCINNIIIE